MGGAPVDGAHDAALGGVLLRPLLLDAQGGQRLAAVFQHLLEAHEVVVRGRTGAIIAQKRGASLEGRQVVGRAVQAALALRGRLLALRHQEHHDHDHGDARHVHRRDGRAQPHGRDDRCRHRLDAAHEAGTHRAGIGDALQVEQVRGERADDHHGTHDAHELGRDVHGDAPRLHEHGGHRAPQEHGQARDDEAAPLRQHLAGKQRVGRQRECRHDAPHEPLGRYGERSDVALRGDEERAAQGEHEAEQLARLRPAPHAHAHDEHDDHEAQAFQHGARARIRVGDGRQVAHLGEQHAEHREGRDTEQRALVAQHGAQAAPVLEEARHEEDEGSQQQAHAGDPRHRHPELARHELGAGSREPPADAAERRERDAACHMAFPGRRLRDCRLTGHGPPPLLVSRGFAPLASISALSHGSPPR